MTLIWGNLSPESIEPCLREAAQAGYDGVTVFAEEVLDPYIDAPAVLASMLAAQGLSLAAVDWRIHDEEARYRRYFEAMNHLGSRLFVCIDPPGFEKSYAKLAKVLNHVAAVAKDYGIRVHYHNHTAAVGETFIDMERLLAETDPELVPVMLDVGHATKDFAELPPSERALRFLERYWDRIDYLELKDWNEHTGLNTPLGEGLAGYDRIFALLRERGYSGWLTVEQNGNDGWSSGRSPLECATISRRFVRDHLGV